MVGKIVVAGDVTIDWLQFEKLYGNSHNWELFDGIKMVPFEGGAILLAKMVEKATNINVSKHELESISDIPPKDVIHSVALLGKYKDKEGNSVYKVKKYCGFSGPDKGSPTPIKLKNDIANPDLVIIDDAGNGFRDFEDAWPQILKDDKKNPVVLMKMSRPLYNGKLWDSVSKNHKEKLVVVVSVNDLREQGVNISRRISWERTAQDFLWQILNNEDIVQLKECSNLIVRLGIEGAIHYQYNDDNPKATIYYDPMEAEDGYRDKDKGEMQGFGCAFVAAIASQIVANGPNDLEGIPDGIKNGIESSKKLLDYGFGEYGGEIHYPYDEIFGKYPNNIAESEIPSDTLDGKKFWTILGSKEKWELKDMVRQIVEEGTENLFIDAPVGSFGGLVTVDRSEIENYHSIRNLMREYLKKGKSERPLSIAVFGPPGSGKSFGVTQLAKTIDPDRVKKIEFNVSQFNEPSDLIVALQKVRDKVLEGKIPLVFFDEFDSSFGDVELGWLKYFLAPMQDGEFKDGESVHPIGQCIFVFAGGTSNSFELFSREEFDDGMGEEEQKQSLLKFRSAKGTDFISRLRGYINIMGPNEYAKGDNFYTVRRAILLRSLLDRKASHLLDDNDILSIDSGVLSAFINITEYKHGVRSMEAIIDMSMLSDRNTFEQSALPAEKQLELLVDSQLFTKLVVKNTLFGDSIEKMAIQIHEKYREDQIDEKPASDPAMQPWNLLKDVFKRSNIDQAKDIPKKLKAFHYGFKPFTRPPTKLIEFEPDELEEMAIMEHDRWCRERREDGWTFGPERNDELKTSPYLVPWEELTEEVKGYDRDAVRNIPEILEKAGFEIYSLK
jgi:hypothetical protein